MDELEISGKRYISSRRAAKENKYHSDYIGQLIRGGKLVGKKVGRAWYVEADSLARFLEQTEEPRHVVHIPHKEDVEVHEKDSAIDAEELPVSPEISVAEEKGSSTEIEVVPHEEEKELVTSVERSIPVRVAQEISYTQHTRAVEREQKKSLTYIPDNSPLFPEIQGNNTLREPELPIVHTMQTRILSERELVSKRKPKHTWRIVAVGGVGALLISVAFVGASIWVASSLTVEEGKPASVGYSLLK